MSSEQIAVNTIKSLGMDAIQKANSGHPGMVLGMADIATVLWHDFLVYDPRDPTWKDRDRVVLSNGHGSMLLYAMLYLTGTSLTLDDIKNFRQWGAPTAGHPEYGFAPGIETTTGPLGQGFANGVGMALAEKWLSEKFGTDLLNHRTYVLCGDGCLMEGVSAEAASLAGHLGLGKLIVLYDDNRITIDGATDLSFSEDVAGRFSAYGWHVLKIDGHDRQAIREAIQQGIATTDKPTMICCRTIIAHGAPTKAGSNKSHGSPLGEEEIRNTKIGMGMDPDQHFAVPEEALAYFTEKDDSRAEKRKQWNRNLASHPQKDEFLSFFERPDLTGVEWPNFTTGSKEATRSSSGKVIQSLAKALPNLLGGSADLAGSNKSLINGSDDISANHFSGRNIHFGVREHGMAAICNGMSLHGGVLPYCATFLVFHDYMKPSVRLASIMHQPVVFIYTHDSIYLGEDGPTHQPVEQLMSMRGIPNLWVVRPADANETRYAWELALSHTDGPTALCLTRQKLPVLDRTDLESASGVLKGGYVLSETANSQVILVATGSEVSLALSAHQQLQQQGIGSKVVSLPCWKVFDMQDSAYKNAVLNPDLPVLTIEAGITFGWERYTGRNGSSIGVDRFGASAPGDIIGQKLGFHTDNIVARAKELLR